MNATIAPIVPVCRFDAQALTAFAEALFVAVGAPKDRAAVMGHSLLNADLLGFGSHGLVGPA